MTNVQQRISGGAVSLPYDGPQNRWGVADSTPGTWPASGDAIRRIPSPNWPSQGGTTASGFGGFGNSMPFGIGTIVSQLLDLVQQLASMLGMGSAFANAQTPQTYFRSATASSTGDPHLGFSGTAGNGSNRQAHFDSMSAHDDLLDSDSFIGGYKISTSVTQPSANGITYNQQATVTTNFGGIEISLDQKGNAVVEENGRSQSLSSGGSIDLGNGETVTRNANGSVVVSDQNGIGGAIATTLSENGHGVDVTSQATNVDLGGDLPG